MNASDAEALGLETGDTAVIENQYGRILRRVSATERMMPGVAAISHGAWSKKNAEGIDIAGPDSAITAPASTGQGQGSYNAQIVAIEPYGGDPLEPDAAFSVSDDVASVE